MQINIPELRQQYMAFQKRQGINGIADPRAPLLDVAGFIHVYSGAMKDISTKANAPNLIATMPASHFGTSEPSFLWKPFLPYKKAGGASRRERNRQK